MSVERCLPRCQSSTEFLFFHSSAEASAQARIHFKVFSKWTTNFATLAAYCFWHPSLFCPKDFSRKIAALPACTWPWRTQEKKDAQDELSVSTSEFYDKQYTTLLQLYMFCKADGKPYTEERWLMLYVHVNQGINSWDGLTNDDTQWVAWMCISPWSKSPYNSWHSACTASCKSQQNLTGKSKSCSNIKLR